MRSLLAIAGMTRAEIEGLLDRAQSFAEGASAASWTGKTVVNLFLEPSTRTRVSFEIAAKRLGASVVNVSQQASSMVKGESLADTARTLDAMTPDVIVMRHAFSGSVEYLDAHVRASVVNAGDGQHEHPTQGLLDALTIRRAKGRVEGLKVAIVGDIRHSRVARSNVHCLTRLGARVAVFGPATLVPPGFEALGARVADSLEDALDRADVVMALRIQKERMEEAFLPSTKEYALGFRIDAARLGAAKRDVLVMHPGPMNRGVEITDAVADGPSSAITDQVANGVFVRMAVLDEVLRARDAGAAAVKRQKRRAG
ncbi:MAG TPA: aspartate carbamoyltransferase catalytic subunit [bacterium]|nr:aspartate carbamoyltransferase catalytic subunit [bacterium]